MKQFKYHKPHIQLFTPCSLVSCEMKSSILLRTLFVAGTALADSQLFPRYFVYTQVLTSIITSAIASTISPTIVSTSPISLENVDRVAAVCAVGKPTDVITNGGFECSSNSIAPWFVASNTNKDGQARDGTNGVHLVAGSGSEHRLKTAADYYYK